MSVSAGRGRFQSMSGSINTRPVRRGRIMFIPCRSRPKESWFAGLRSGQTECFISLTCRFLVDYEMNKTVSSPHVLLLSDTTCLIQANAKSGLPIGETCGDGPGETGSRPRWGLHAHGSGVVNMAPRIFAFRDSLLRAVVGLNP